MTNLRKSAVLHIYALRAYVTVSNAPIASFAVSIAAFASLAPKRNEVMKTTKIITNPNQYE